MIATSKFALEVKATIGLESTYQENWLAKIVFKGPHEV